MRSDQQLVEAVLGGERAAYGSLVERYERAAQAVALRVLHDPDAAQDAAQEAFVTAYERLGSLRQRAAFGPWLLTIVRREALRLRRQQRKARPLADAANQPDPHDQRRLGDDAQELLDAVTRLPEHERHIVMLRYFEGHSVSEIAEITQRPLGTVTKQLSRAHRRLGKWLAEEIGP